MPRTYDRKQGANYGSCDPNDLENAVLAVKSKKLSVRKAAVAFNVKRSTLHDAVKGKHPRLAGNYI